MRRAIFPTTRLITIILAATGMMLSICCGRATYYIEDYNILYGVSQDENRGVFYTKKHSGDKVVKLAIKDADRYGNCFFITWIKPDGKKDGWVYSLNSYMWSYVKQNGGNYIIFKHILNGKTAVTRKIECDDTSWVGNYNSFLFGYFNLFIYGARSSTEELHFMQKKDGKIIDFLLCDFSGPIYSPGKFDFMDKLTLDVIKYELVPRSLLDLPDSTIQNYLIENQ